MLRSSGLSRLLRGDTPGLGIDRELHEIAKQLGVSPESWKPLERDDTPPLHDGEEPKARTGPRFESSVFDPLRDAVAHLRDVLGDHGASLDREMRQAISDRVKALSDQHNEGQPFPPRTGPLPPGRRRKKGEPSSR